MEAGIKEITAYDHQSLTIDALDDGKRYIAMIGGTGSGKTYWGPWWLADLISRDCENENRVGAKYLVIGRTYRMLHDTLIPLLKEAYRGTYLEGRFSASQDIYYLPTGGIIYFRSADNPFRIEGIHARGAWIDEPSEMPSLIWIIIQARLGLFKGPALFSGYPTNMGWYYSAIYLPWLKGDELYECISFPSTANPMYDPEEMERAKGTMPLWMWEMRYLGLFRKPMGLVYPDYGETDMYVEPFDIDPQWPSWVVLDPGIFYGGLFTFWHDGIYYSYDDYFVNYTRSAEDHAADLKAKVQGACEGWLYDPARLNDVVNLMQFGCGPFYPANNPVMAGIETVAGMIKSGKWKIFRGKCPHLDDQMRKYSYMTDPVSGEVAGVAPIKRDDHLPDCGRYQFHTLKGLPLKSRQRVVVGGGEGISEY